VTQVQNVGNQTAPAFTALYWCDYMMDNGKSVRVKGETVPVPGHIFANEATTIDGGQCDPYQGRAAYRVGVTIAAPGDIDNSNNSAEKSFL
jgi:hypothetical protein